VSTLDVALDSIQLGIGKKTRFLLHATTRGRDIHEMIVPLVE